MQPLPRYQPPPRGSHLPPYEEPLGPSAEPQPAPGNGLSPRRRMPARAGRMASARADGDRRRGHRPAPDRSEEADRDPGRRVPQPRAHDPRGRDLPAGGGRRRRRPLGADGPDVRDDGQLRRRRRAGRRPRQHAVLRRRDRGVHRKGAAVPASSRRAVRRHRAVHRAGAGSTAARPADRAGRRRVFARAVLALVMAFNFDSWVLYPAALGMLVLSKSFSVLKAAVTPRVLPPDITLVKTNSRLTVFGLIAGGVAGRARGPAGVGVRLDRRADLHGAVRDRAAAGCACGSRPGWSRPRARSRSRRSAGATGRSAASRCRWSRRCGRTAASGSRPGSSRCSSPS